MNTVMNLVKNKKIRNWGIAALAVLIMAFLVWSFFSANKGSAQASTESTVTSLSVGESIQTSGSLSAQPFARLEWKTGGVVESVNVKAGDFVKAGDTLLTLQPSSASANIVSAKADLVQAQKDLETLLESDNNRAQAAIDLKDAQDAYKNAYNYRISLNKEIWIKSYTYTYMGGHQISIEHWDLAYADAGTIANADRSLALKKAKLEDAQRAYDRLKDGPNAQDVAAQQAKVDAAQATVNSLSIIAPFDGKVLSVDGHVGDVVNTSDLAVNLGDTNHLYVQTQVDESDIAKIKLGDSVQATLDAVPGLTLTGQVSAINPVGEVVSGLVKYKVRVDLGKPDGDVSLPLGATTNVVIQIKAASATLAVPVTAIQNDSKGEYVWLIKEDGSTTRVDVVSGSIVGDLVTVTGDLKEGDRISTVQSSGNGGPGGPFGG